CIQLQCIRQSIEIYSHDHSPPKRCSASNCNAYATQFETYSHDHSRSRRCSASNCNVYATQFETYSHDHSPPRSCSASNFNAYALNLRHTAMTILHRGGVLHPIAMHTPPN